MRKHVFSCNFKRNIVDNALFYQKMTNFATIINVPLIIKQLDKFHYLKTEKKNDIKERPK
jgi:hypothetical protein